MTDFYVHYQIDDLQAKTGFIKAVSSRVIKGFEDTVLKVPEAVALKFIRDKESPNNWEIQWDGEKMVLAKKDTARMDCTMWRPLFQLKHQVQDPIVWVILVRDTGQFVIYGDADQLEGIEDNTRIWFFVTKKDDPNVIYQKFFALAEVIKYDMFFHDAGDWLNEQDDFYPCSVYVRPDMKNGVFGVK